MFDQFDDSWENEFNNDYTWEDDDMEQYERRMLREDERLEREDAEREWQRQSTAQEIVRAGQIELTKAGLREIIDSPLSSDWLRQYATDILVEIDKIEGYADDDV
jgi:hypothetical protein